MKKPALHNIAFTLVPSLAALWWLPVQGADVSVKQFANMIGFPTSTNVQSGGRLTITTSLSTAYLIQDSTEFYTGQVYPNLYDVWACKISTSNPSAPKCATSSPARTCISCGNRHLMFGYSGSVPYSVGAPSISADGKFLILSAADPSIVGYCSSGYLSTPGQGCANNVWVCPITLSTSGIAINGAGTKVCTEITSVVVNPSPGKQQGILYGRFSNTITVASVSGGNSYIGFAQRMANPDGSAAGTIGCYQVGLLTWHEDSSSGAFVGDPVTFYSPSRPGYTSTCVAAEASGFFSGMTNATDYTKNTDTDLFCYDSNLDGQASWRWQGYCFNFTNPNSNNVDQIVNWGSTAGLICDWNEHFHPDALMQRLIFYSSHDHGTNYNGCLTGEPGPAPLDAWETSLIQWVDTNGFLHITSNQVLYDQAYRLTYVNVAGSTDYNFVCSLLPTAAACGGSFGGGNSQWGPDDTYFALVNAPNQSTYGSAILTLSRNAIASRISGATTIKKKAIMN